MLENVEEKIVAIALFDHNQRIRILQTDSPVYQGDIFFQDSWLKVGNLCISHHWFVEMTLCTQEVLDYILREISDKSPSK